MIEENKTNATLGHHVKEYLKSKHLLNIEMGETSFTDAEKKQKLEELFGEFLNIMGLNRKDGNLTETPKRLAKLYVNELCYGLNWDNFPKCTVVDNQFVGYNNFVLVKDIRITSICSHHFMPFFGIKGNSDGHATLGPGCTIAYIPDKKVLGLSKFSRIVEFLGARPNTQETLTAQIAETVSFVTQTDDVAVSINANHTCMSLRGARDPNANTVTLFCKGKFLTNDKLRNEFLNASK